jgi:hypothetical protein
MITTSHLGAVIDQHWHALADRARPPGHLSFLLLTKGRDPVGKIVLLTFVAGETLPRFVVKLSRLKRHNDTIKAEYRNLHLIDAHGRVRTPTPLLCWEEDGRRCLLESVLDGPDLWRTNSRARSLAFLDPIVDWLIHLARQTVGPRTAHPAEAFTATDRSPRGPRSVRREARRAGGDHPAPGQTPAVPLPQIVQHDNMGTWNMTVATSAVHRYVDALGLSRGWLGPLIMACWLEQETIDVEREGVQLGESLSWQMLVVTLERDCRFSSAEEA